MRTIFIILIFSFFVQKNWAQDQNNPLYFPSIHTTVTDGKQVLDFINENNNLFNIKNGVSQNLKFDKIKESLLGRHYYYNEYINGIPIEGSQIVVSINDSNRVYKVYNGLVNYTLVKSRNTINSEDAIDVVWQYIRIHGPLTALPKSDLFYFNKGDTLILGYKVLICAEAPSGYWLAKVDADSKEIIEIYDDVITKRNVRKYDFSVYNGKILSRNDAISEFQSKSKLTTSQVQTASLLATTVNGSAQVFDPDPRTTLNNGTLVDTSPASSFTAAYFNRTLNQITLNNGTYSLVGPWVQIVDFQFPNTLPSTTSNGIWNFTRGNTAFNDAMTYFHIDQNQRYIQSIGFIGAKGIQDSPIQADANGYRPELGEDNSYFSPTTNSLVFGHGGVDDNEDADVILHEYMHALLHDINNNYDLGRGDMGAIGEGFGDYWGGSYSYGTPNGQVFNPDWIFSWDGHNSFWPGRVMNKTNAQYVPGITYYAHQNFNGFISDELWSTPIFQAMRQLITSGVPKTEVDKIILESNFGLGASITMPVMATSIVNTASTLYPSGNHSYIFLRQFINYNILTCNFYPYPQHVFANSSFIGTSTGSFCMPYKTFNDGQDAISQNGTFHLVGGTYTGVATIDKAMTIVAQEGLVTITN